MVLLASDYASRFLNAADLDRERKFKIEGVTEELVGAAQEKMLVVWFTNHKRGLVLNKTNNLTIRSAFGDPVDGWVGKIIIIFPTMVELRGKLTPGLRVRIPPPKQAGDTAAGSPSNPAQSGKGNGAATAAPPPKPTTATPGDDPGLADEPPKSLGDELDDQF
jgi:hypothetical protein